MLPSDPKSVHHRIILDCDPGVDDAVAILLALGAPDSLTILGITTVAGNVGLDKTTRNACMLRQIAKREDIAVFQGLDKPLVRAPILADDFHGPEGLGTLLPFEPKLRHSDKSAVDFIIEALRSEPRGTITLAVTGPLTNIAAVLKEAPDCAQRIKEIVIMGGARSEGGNITASAEYNIFADPDAAEIVTQSGCNLTFFGLDATHQVRGTDARIAQIAAIGTPSALAAASTMAFSNTLSGNMLDSEGAPLHDPCVIAYLLVPEAFEFRPCTLSVETKSDLTRGHTAVEFRGGVAGPFNAKWAVKADADIVFKTLVRHFYK